MSQDYYSILGVPRDATSNDIKRAFRQIARECHPDVAGEDHAAEERFKQARKAYETLMDPVTRARYDRRGQRRHFSGGSFFDAFYRATGAQEEQRRPGASSRSYGNSDAGGNRGHRRNDPGNDIGLDDLFNDFGFGNGAGRARATSGPSTEPPPGLHAKPGGDVQVDVRVPARVARDGGSVTVTYHRLQRADGWRPGAVDHGLVRVEDIAEVRIIPGTPSGAVLRERGLGDAGAYGGPYGDLLARVVIVGTVDDEPPPPPRAEPAVRSVDISVVEAILGGRIEVDTPQGKVRVSIPAGTSSGTHLRLKNRGPNGPDGQPTDLHVEVRIVVPRNLDAESRALIERFAQLNPWDPRQQ